MKRGWIVAIGAALLLAAVGLAVLPAGAQEGPHCTAEDISGALDGIETALATAREAVAGGDLAGAVELLGQIADEAKAGQAACTSAGGQAIDPNAPKGSIANPIPLGEAFAIVDMQDDQGRMQIDSVLRPADEFVSQQARFNPEPEDGQEWVVVHLTIYCDLEIGDICEPNFITYSLRLGTTGGRVYERNVFVNFEEELGTQVMGGGQVSGYVAYAIDKGEDGLFLLFNPDSSTRIFFATE